MLRRALASIALMALFATAAAARDVAVISGKSGVVQAVAVQELEKICTGKMTKWPDGREIKIFVSDPSSPGMKMVIEQIFNLNGGDIRSALQKVPGVKIVKSDQEVISNVAQVPGAIGFVDIYSINGTVAVVKVEGKLPLEPGYVLHKSQ